MTKLNHKNTGGLISVAIGAPVGLISMYFGLLMPAALFGEGFILAMAAPLLLYPVLGLLVSFLLTLWFAGRAAANNLAKGQNLFFVSFKYSIAINFVIWTVFYLVLIFTTSGAGAMIFLYLPAALMLIGTILAPFTIGLFICYMIKRKVSFSGSATEDLSGDGELHDSSEVEIDNPKQLFKRYEYECEAGTLVIEQKLPIPSGDDVAFINDKLAPSGKYKIGENKFVFVSNGYIYAVRGFSDKGT